LGLELVLVLGLDESLPGLVPGAIAVLIATASGFVKLWDTVGGALAGSTLLESVVALLEGCELGDLSPSNSLSDSCDIIKSESVFSTALIAVAEFAETLGDNMEAPLLGDDGGLAVSINLRVCMFMGRWLGEPLISPNLLMGEGGVPDIKILNLIKNYTIKTLFYIISTTELI